MNQAVLGIAALLLLAWLVSSDRQRFPLKLVITSLLLQFTLAALLLKLPLLQDGLKLVNQAVIAIQAATEQGTRMVFGYLGGAAEPFVVVEPDNSFILAFRALPIVIVFSALSALLWHWRIIPIAVRALGKLLAHSLGLSGAVSVASASSIFVGMVESPLLIKPYLKNMSDSELFMLMTCGMATVAGTVMALFAGILADSVPEALSHILIASLISAPAAIMLAAVMIPPHPASANESIEFTSPYSGSMDAIVTGTGDGLRLLASIIGMLIVFMALVFMVDSLLQLIPIGNEPLSLVGILGWVLQPLAWLIGIPWAETSIAGELMATKIIINEMVAYIDMNKLAANQLSNQSRQIMTYALCGFANFGSLGIMIGGLTAMCPQRSSDILRLAPRSIVSGFLATCMTGAVIALLL